jgi:hypothetical protein
MSFDIFLDAYYRRMPTSFPRKIVEEIFAPMIAGRDDRGWDLDPIGRVYIDDTAEIGGFSVNRPPETPAFWDAMLTVLRRTPSVLYWPGRRGGCACVADPDVIRNMPADMVESLGEPLVVTSGAAIREAIRVS